MSESGTERKLEPSHGNTRTSPFVDAEFARGVAFHRRGQLGEAEHVYRSVLRTQPQHFGAAYILGVLSLQRGEIHDAERKLRLAIEINPGIAAPHSDLGIVLKS